VQAPDGSDLDVLQQADDRVSFPTVLSGLGSVGGLAADSNGHVWIPVFTGGDNGHVLYRYDPGDGKIDTFPLPDNPGSAISSAIAVSPTHQVVLGYGGIIAVLDPGTGSFKTYDLPANSPNFVQFGGGGGSWSLT
jgi:streptogramin lyase